jgi:hypothetical protein
MMRARRSTLVVTLTASIVLVSCGALTGLSDDFRYDLDGGSSGSSGTASDGQAGDGAAAADGGDDGAASVRQQCNTAEKQQASTEMAAVDPLSAGTCRNCLASNCCLDIDRCAKDTKCADSMKCVFQCIRDNGGGGAKQVCVNNCDPTFMATLGSCLRDACGSGGTCGLSK